MRGCQDGSLSEAEQQEFLFIKDRHAKPTIEIERLWHYVTIDPIEDAQNRDDQLAFCGRQGHQPIAMFDDWSLIRFNHIYLAFIRQLQKETEAAEQARREMAMRDSR